MAPEIEAKFYPVDKDAIRERLRAKGFALIHPEYMMRRTAFKPPENVDASFGRVRQEADCVTISLKRMRERSLSGNKELCIRTDSYDAAVEFMKEIGMTQKAYQETRRELWQKNSTEVVIDTWPGLKPLVEIEAPDEDAVKVAATELGFDMKDALYGAVDIIAERELGISCEELNERTPLITFEHPLQSRK